MLTLTVFLFANPLDIGRKLNEHTEAALQSCSNEEVF